MKCYTSRDLATHHEIDAPPPRTRPKLLDPTRNDFSDVIKDQLLRHLVGRHMLKLQVDELKSELSKPVKGV